MFYALWPDAAVRALIADAAAALRSSGAARPVPPENYHLTLAFVGDEVPSSSLAVLQQIGRSQREPACTISLDAYEHWRESRVVVAVARETPAALTLLSARLRAALKDRQAEPPLRAHVTLARKVAQAPVLQAMSAIEWHAKAFSLVSSDTHGPRAVYTVVDTWPLLDETPIP
ncbi:MAG TPA: RNA 2',3'-cyclic phosphodiesterase [Steroidobacteraceae bacterium]